MRWSRALKSAPAAALAGLAAYDLVQNKHALLRNFPVIGHGRYLLESVGPELRQYIVTDNNEERPFSRDQRRWVYASSKLENNYFGFGTDNDVEHTDGYPIIKHRTFSEVAPPSSPAAGEETGLPSAKVLGGPRGRRQAFRPGSLVNISAMSYGSLSGPAVEALNRGAALAGCLHNTGEGGISPYHRNGGDLVLPDRHRLLRLPGRAGQVRPAAAQGPGRLGAGQGAGDQAQPGREAGPGRPPSRRQGHPRDRRDPRHQPGRGLHQPVAPRGVRRHRRHARLGGAARRGDRSPCGDQVGGR